MGADPKAPTPQESTAQMLQAYTNAFPELLQITNAGQVPAAQAQLAANQAVAPELAALQAELYKNFGPGMSATADQIMANSDLSRANSDLNVLNGPGKDIAQSALDVQKIADPEYYKTRESVGGGIDQLLKSIDLSGKLSPGEDEAMSRRIAQENQNRGIADNPSATAAAKGALTFGEAGAARKAQSTNQLTQALNVANSSLPALKSGVDVFQQVTGRPSMANAGDSKFTGVDTTLGNSSQNLGSNLLGQVGGLTSQQNDINSKRRDQLDRFNESFSSVVGSL